MDRTIGAFSKFFDESSYAEGYASKRGLLQFVDPRFKLIGMLWLVVCVILVTRVEWILATLGVTLLLAVTSKVRLGYYLRRVWLFIPLFTLVIAIPAMFNFIVPGQALFVILSKGQPLGSLVSPWTISITVPGVQGAILFILRTGTAVSLVILLALTTRWTELLASLQSLKVPTAFVMILGMTYRYVFVLVGIAQDMSFALKSRTLSSERNANVREWLGATIGVLFRRSMNMSELVNLSMISRGYDGRVRKVTEFRAEPFDWAFLGFLLGLGVLLLTLRNITVLNGI
ncbi:MAG TPA: cobalt ECF transporter T component CbiQ [Terriglobales bacterium]|nr:cobalt ECF transporter T component CbiQ [Terriglobales bacterium]